MPNRAFFNLSEEKRDPIISAAMEEFSSAGYDTASINRICKMSGIAKGSFYQYFKDKLDLYVYIMTMAIEKKVSFFSAALVYGDSLTLPEQLRLLFLKGIEYAAEYPQYAALGEQFSKEDNLTAKSTVIKEGEKQSHNLFSQMIEHAKSKGEIRENVDTLALSMLLQTLNRAVTGYMTNGSANDNDGRTCKSEETIKLVDSLLDIIHNGIKPIQ